MGGIADRGTLPYLLIHHRSNTLLFGFAALGSISSLLSPSPSMATFRPSLYSRQDHLQRFYRSAQFVPAVPRRLFSSFVGSRRHGEAVPCNCRDFLPRNRSWIHRRYPPPAGRTLSGPGRRLVHQGAAIRHCRLRGLVGSFFRTRSSIPALRERIPGKTGHGRARRPPRGRPSGGYARIGGG
jgi:hypothetical protein